MSKMNEVNVDWTDIEVLQLLHDLAGAGIEEFSNRASALLLKLETATATSLPSVGDIGELFQLPAEVNQVNTEIKKRTSQAGEEALEAARKAWAEYWKRI
jgi:hypothetical protein